jgi:hypothetical protein
MRVRMRKDRREAGRDVEVRAGYALRVQNARVALNREAENGRAKASGGADVRVAGCGDGLSVALELMRAGVAELRAYLDMLETMEKAKHG